MDEDAYSVVFRDSNIQDSSSINGFIDYCVAAV